MCDAVSALGLVQSVEHMEDVLVVSTWSSKIRHCAAEHTEVVLEVSTQNSALCCSLPLAA